MLSQEVAYFRDLAERKQETIEELKATIEVMHDERRVINAQNVAACDAKTEIEEGLIDGNDKLTIIQKAHAKLREVTPDLTREDMEDEAARPIIDMIIAEMKDKSTQA